MMTPAWYVQSRLTPKPAPRPELEDDEDEEGMLQSVKYIESLINDLIQNDSIPTERIVVGGFSQGMAISSLLSLVSARFAGKLGGILAVCGYLPIEKRIASLRAEHEISPNTTPGITKLLVMRGKADVLVPKRYIDIVRERLKENGYVDGSNLQVKEYDGVGHTITGDMIKDMAAWMEQVVPETKT